MDGRRHGLGWMAWVLVGRLCLADAPWGGSVGVTSNYVYRGVSLTDNRGALQLGLDYQNRSGWFAGAWGSNVDPYPGHAAFGELDVYAGYRRPLGDDFSFSGMFTHYAYLRNPLPLRCDHDEMAATLSYLDVLEASVSYQPNSSSYSELGAAQKRTALAYELTARCPLGMGLSVTAGAGYYDLHDLYRVDYWAGDVGLSYARRRLTLDLSRFFSAPTVARLYEGASANGTWVVTAIWRF